MKRELAKRADASETLQLLLNAAEDAKATAVQVQTLTQELDSMRRDNPSKRVQEQLQQQVEGLRQDIARRAMENEKAQRELHALQVEIRAAEGKLTKVAEDAAAVAVLRRSCKDSVDAIAGCRADMRELVEETGIDRERTDRAELRLNELEKALGRCARVDQVSRELDDLNTRLHDTAEELTKDTALVRADGDVAREDLRAISVRLADTFPALHKRVDEMSSEVANLAQQLAATRDFTETEKESRERSELDVRLALQTLEETGQRERVELDKKNADLTTKTKAILRDVEQVSLAVANVDDVVGTDGINFFELLQRMNDAEKKQSEAEGRFQDVEGRLGRSEEMQLMKLESLANEPGGVDHQQFVDLLARVVEQEKRVVVAERGLSHVHEVQERLRAMEAAAARLEEREIKRLETGDRAGPSARRLEELEKQVRELSAQTLQADLGRVEMVDTGAARLGGALDSLDSKMRGLMDRVEYMESGSRHAPRGVPAEFRRADEGGQSVPPVLEAGREVCAGEVSVEGAVGYWNVSVDSTTPLLSPPFVILGIEGRLKILPRPGLPQESEPILCGLYLRCSAGTHILFRLYASGTWHDPLNGDYPKRKDKGKHLAGGFRGATTVGVEVLEIEGRGTQ